MTEAGARWVDGHCHLYLHGDDPGALLDRAAAAGVAWVMCPGVDAGSSAAARDIARREPGRVLWSAGVHPHEASRYPAEEAAIAEMAVEAAAVGECGLDFYRDLSPRTDQVQAFRAQIALAEELAKPLIVHCRDAFAETHELLGEAALGANAVLHCWTGGSRWTRRFADLGATFSFAGPLTYATADTLRRAATVVPPERTMVETDTPYLTPEPHRRERNEPALLPLTGSVLAEVWGTTPEDVAVTTSRTATAVFGTPG